MRILIGYIGLYLIITFGSMFIASVLKKKIEKTIAISLGIDILLLFLFAAFDFLKIGVIFVSIANIILGIIAIIKEKKNIKDIVFTPGFGFFTIIYIILAITTFNKALVDWDHFSYRSLNVKMAFNTDSIKEYARFYPPVTTLLEYFFMKVIGIYRQGIEAFAMQIFGFSLMIPIFNNIKNNRFAKFTVAAIVLCIPAVFRNLVFYESAYPDATIGLLLGYILYTYFTEDYSIYKFISIGIAVSMLILTKPLGIAVTLISICIMIIYEFLKNKYLLKEKIISLIKSKEIRFIIGIILVSIIAFGSWEMLQKSVFNRNTTVTLTTSGRVEGEPTNYVLDSVITTVFGKYQENNDGAISNRHLITSLYDVTALNTPIKLSLIATALLFVTGYVIYYYKTKDNKFKFITLSIVIGLIFYIGILQLSYLTKFVTFEMLGHNGIDRYFPSYLIAMLYFICAIVINNLSKKEYDAKPYLIMLIAIFVITPIGSVCDATITSGIYNIDSNEYVNNARNIAEKIDNSIEDDSRVIAISQEAKTRLYNIMLKYYLYPNHDVKLSENLTLKSASSIEKVLENYQYIYVFSTDNDLLEMLNMIFDNVDVIKAKTLYKIEYNNEKINLVEYAYLDEKF